MRIQNNRTSTLFSFFLAAMTLLLAGCSEGPAREPAAPRPDAGAILPDTAVGDSGHLDGAVPDTAAATDGAPAPDHAVSVDAPNAGQDSWPPPPPPTSACSAKHKRVVNVASAKQLTAALSGAKCGDGIVLAKGAYSGSFKIGLKCPSTAPVVIRGAKLLAPVITSELILEGDRAVVCGLTFKGSRVTVKGHHNRVIRSRFSGWKHPAAILALAGSHVEIGCNELSDPSPWLKQGGASYPLRIGVRTGYKTSFHSDGWIHHNHFHDFPPKPNPADYHSGQSDAMEICFTGYNKPAKFTIEHNLIERHKGGHGLVDLKCGGSTVRFNTILTSPGGRIDLRNGSYGRVAGNWIEGAGGIGVHGGHHEIVGNRLINTGSGITLLAGTHAWDDWSTSSLKQQAYKAQVVGNIADKLVLGKSYGPTFTFPAQSCSVEAHSGPITKGFHKGTVFSATPSLKVVKPVKLTPKQVGPLVTGGCS